MAAPPTDTVNAAQKEDRRQLPVNNEVIMVNTTVLPHSNQTLAEERVDDWVLGTVKEDPKT